MFRALSSHWPEYLIEAGCLAAFMVSANVFAAAIFHPSSPVSRWVSDPIEARFLTSSLTKRLTAGNTNQSPPRRRTRLRTRTPC